MSISSGIRWIQVKVADRLGAGAKGQSCDGTFTAGNLPEYSPAAADGTLTDSGVPAANVVTTLTTTGTGAATLVGHTLNIPTPSGGGGSGTCVDEIPSGSLNGSNTSFTLSHTPVTGSLILQLNGVTQMPGGVDFTLSGSTITMRVAPKARDTNYFLANYQY